MNFRGGDITGRDDQYYYAIVSRGKGLNQDRSANVFEGSGGGRPLLEIGEIMRDALRAIRFDPVTDEQPDYVEFGEWGLNEGFGIDAFQVKIWVGTQLPLFNPLQANLTPV